MMGASLEQLVRVRSVAVRNAADSFTGLARRLRARRSASVDGLAGDEGVDLRLRVNAASGAAAGGERGEAGWMHEVTEFLETRSARPHARASTCALWFADSGQRGVFALLGPGGAGKSWSTAQGIARQAETLAAGLREGSLQLEGDWVAPFWVHAPTLMDFLPKLANLLASENRPAGDAITRFLWFLDWFRAGEIGIGSSVRPEGGNALRTILARKIQAGSCAVVFDAINELGARLDERCPEMFHDIVKALSDRVSDGHNPHPGRLVFCCRPEAWEETALRKLPLPENCVRATRCDLLPPEPEQIDEMARRYHPRLGGAWAGTDPGTGRTRWERLSRHGDPHQGGWSPLMLALILGAGLALEKARSLDVAAIFDKVCDAFLRGSWHERGSHLANAEGLGITPTPNLDDRFATAKEIVCLTSWFLFRQNPGGNAFRSDHWVRAFEDAMGSLSHAGRRAMLGARVPDPREQALAWLRACNDQGLLARDGDGFRYLHHLLFSYLAAYGLAMLGPEAGELSDPWTEAFHAQGIDHGRVNPACSSLFSFLPGVAMSLLHGGEADRRARDEAETALRLTGLCRAVRESVAMDFSGLTTVLRLAIAGHCNGIDHKEKKLTLLDAMHRFPLDGGVTARLRSDGRLAEFAGDDVAAGVEAEVREQLRIVESNPRVRPFWVREILLQSGNGSLWTRWLHSREVKDLLPAVHWLLAVGAPEQAKKIILMLIRRWGPRMTPRLRVVTLQMIHTLSRTAPEVFSPAALRSAAQGMYDDALAILSLPHAVNALSNSRSDLVHLQSFALGHPPDPALSSRGPAQPLWQAREVRAVWTRALVEPATLPPHLRRTVNLSMSLVQSIAREECDFWLWFRAAYLHQAPSGSDRHQIAVAARYLIRRRLPERYFYCMAVAVTCTLLLRMPDASETGVSLSKMSAVGRDFAYLSPPSSWPNVSKLIRRGILIYWLLVVIGGIYLFVLLLRQLHEPSSNGQTHWISPP